MDTEQFLIILIIAFFAYAGVISYFNGEQKDHFCESKGFTQQHYDFMDDDIIISCEKPDYYCEGEICVERPNPLTGSFPREQFELWKKKQGLEK